MTHLGKLRANTRVILCCGGLLTPSTETVRDVTQDADTKTERLALENRLTLECTQPWVTAPRALLLAGGSRTFEASLST